MLLISFIDEHFLLTLLGMGGIATYVWVDMHGERLGIGHFAALVLTAACVFAGVACVKAFAFMESSGSAKGAMSLFGAVFFMPVLFVLGAKAFGRDAARVCDVLTPCMVFTVMCARINCLHAGCCHGIPIGGTGLQWPTREIEIVYYVVFLVAVCGRVHAGVTRGEVYPEYMATYGAMRFCVEWVRYTSSHLIFHAAHVWALLSLCLGASMYFEIKSQLSFRGGRSRR